MAHSLALLASLFRRVHREQSLHGFSNSSQTPLIFDMLKGRCLDQEIMVDDEAGVDEGDVSTLRIARRMIALPS